MDLDTSDQSPTKKTERFDVNSEGSGDFFAPSNPLSSSMESCLQAFARDSGSGLNNKEFQHLCEALFHGAKDEQFKISPNIQTEMFSAFDTNGDGFIDSVEFEICWQKWISKILHPVPALVIVDVQNDFISGSLGVSKYPTKQDGAEVIEPINRLLASVKFNCVFYSLDWHPEDHICFIDNVHLRRLHDSSEIRSPGEASVFSTVVFDRNPPYTQTLFPRHCVQNSWGAMLHENLTVLDGSQFIYKGTNPEVDSYSAFFDNTKQTATPLLFKLKALGVTDVYVCGLSYECCVVCNDLKQERTVGRLFQLSRLNVKIGQERQCCKANPVDQQSYTFPLMLYASGASKGATALDSIKLGFRTVVIEDATRGANFQNIATMRENIICNHGIVVTSNELRALAQGLDRRVELGYKMALDFKSGMSV